MSGEPLSLVVLVARVPAGGKHFRVEANDQERHAVAAALGIVEVAELTAELDVRPTGRDAYAVRGALSATVVQTDVVTLEPVRQEVREEVDVTLVPAEDGSTRKEKTEMETGIDAAEDRDVYRNGRIDLGALVVEHLALGLDPYPKSPGTEFPGHFEPVSNTESSPFSVLAGLKREPE